MKPRFTHLPRPETSLPSFHTKSSTKYCLFLLNVLKIHLFSPSSLPLPYLNYHHFLASSLLLPTKRSSSRLGHNQSGRHPQTRMLLLVLKYQPNPLLLPWRILQCFPYLLLKVFSSLTWSRRSLHCLISTYFLYSSLATPSAPNSLLIIIIITKADLPCVSNGTKPFEYTISFTSHSRIIEVKRTAQGHGEVETGLKPRPFHSTTTC